MNTVERKIQGTLTPDQMKALDALKKDERNNKLLAGQNLGKDQFLKILLEQLKNQNPLNPVEDKEFIAQMAQFSQLEETRSMSESMGSIKNEISELSKGMLINRALSIEQTKLLKEIAGLLKSQKSGNVEKPNKPDDSQKTDDSKKPDDSKKTDNSTKPDKPATP